MIKGAIGRKLDYNDAYQKEHITRVVVKLNDKTDQDIIEHLALVKDSGMKIMGYIKELIRKDME